ncbi:acetolactate synthase small subunit [Clostridium cellulovorans]|uniref:Acetolactate synthase small subunit n=1 Tax=Clostridium cellulovorans (strain ATCC 35296 / DSM 3052 / OCM 3 / 743B) TaxID=573061 RepID=D9SVE9_CLOC7|nr:acetolactate synthase small subunit [Clostridium cellulovorans]ADL51073.1 acetolactate synthase, small subunit [Clostridium cellulovorans 743B]
MDRHIISVLVKNSAGVLSRVAGLFTRRGFNIESLTVGSTENPEFSRMTITMVGDNGNLEQIKNQLNKLYDVVKVVELKADNSVIRELVLIKVNATDAERGAINEVAKIFRCKIVDISEDTLTIELTGDESKISALIKLMEKYGIREIVRTGIVALERGENDIQSYEEAWV